MATKRLNAKNTKVEILTAYNDLTKANKALEDQLKAAQKMGISLASIKEAFASLPNARTPDKDDWSRLSSAWQAELNQRIEYLERLRDSLEGCIACGCLSMKNCPIYNPDDELAVHGPGPVILDKNER